LVPSGTSSIEAMSLGEGELHPKRRAKIEKAYKIFIYFDFDFMQK
jgi:hypothetical protein